MLERYGNRSGDSGVKAYEILEDGIRVQFVDGETYTYTFESAGPEQIEHMRRLAKAGKGLSGYIAAHVRHRYAAKSGKKPGQRRASWTSIRR